MKPGGNGSVLARQLVRGVRRELSSSEPAQSRSLRACEALADVRAPPSGQRVGVVRGRSASPPREDAPASNAGHRALSPTASACFGGWSPAASNVRLAAAARECGRFPPPWRVDDGQRSRRWRGLAIAADENRAGIEPGAMRDFSVKVGKPGAAARSWRV